MQSWDSIPSGDLNLQPLQQQASTTDSPKMIEPHITL